MADVSKVNVNSTDYNIKDSNAMHKGVDRVTAGQSIIAPIGTASTADGFAVNASGDYSHASGLHTIAASDVQHVIGKYNEEDANGTYPFIIGGGRLDTDRKNIFTVDWNGDVNAGRSNGLTNDTKLPTGADVVSYLNSNIVSKLLFGGNSYFHAKSGDTTIDNLINEIYNSHSNVEHYFSCDHKGYLYANGTTQLIGGNRQLIFGFINGTNTFDWYIAFGFDGNIAYGNRANASTFTSKRVNMTNI